MARVRPVRTRPSHSVLVIDDDPQLAAAHAALLKTDGHTVHVETDPRAGVEAVRRLRPDLVLLDYYMPCLLGPDVVRAIRQFDPLVQIVLVTGYAEEHPARALLAELEIQGYHDKSDGPARLLVHVDAALKHGRALARIDRQRHYLRFLLDEAHDVTRLQPQEALFRTAVEKVAKLVGSTSGLVATVNNGLFVLETQAQGVAVRGGIGRFAGVSSVHELPPGLRERVVAAVHDTSGPCVADGLLIVPLETRDGDPGCIVVEDAALPEDAVEPCMLLAQQVVHALENVILYELATTDAVTRVANRRFGMQRLEDSFDQAVRSGAPIGVIMVDLDRFKSLNDTLGHAAGDLALVTVAAILKRNCRAGDVVARYGGEEFLVILPGVSEEVAARRAEQMRQAIASWPFCFEGVGFQLTASFGVATDTVEGGTATQLVAVADTALYQAKRSGRNRVVKRSEFPAAEQGSDR